jgi:hypothetical protein
MISDASVDRRHHSQDKPERHGRPALITNQQIKEMDRIIHEDGFEAGIEGIQARTIARGMGDTMGDSKCIACQKQWVNKSTALHRKEWSKVTLERHPKPEDWHNIRFSDEVHWGFGPHGSICITRKPGEILWGLYTAKR